MPYRMQWEDPEIFITHNGVPVYHVYRNDDADDVTLDYHYTLNFLSSADDRAVFDVRDLKSWKSPTHPPFLVGADDTLENRKLWDEYQENRIEERAIEAAIREALNTGELKPPNAAEDDAEDDAAVSIRLLAGTGAFDVENIDPRDVGLGDEVRGGTGLGEDVGDLSREADTAGEATKEYV